jgi:ABC-type Fe3+/spermidine/putrescine transport system ATPase subunit
VSSSEPRLTVRGLRAEWGPTPVFDGISFDVAPGELLALLGPNGSGKTTLLRCIAGLERPARGQILLDGVDVTGLPPHRRGVGLVFQDAALFSQRTVFENIAYAPLLQRRPIPEVEAEVDRLVRLLRLGGLEERRPEHLSGGEQQRVALARTLAARPRVVLLDEPFASIDVELKAELRAEFRRVLRTMGVSAVHVTHDREEGMFLGDRVALLLDGELASIGAPTVVFAQPRTARSARFLGYNILPGRTGWEAVDPRDLELAPRTTPGVPLTVVAAGTTGTEQLVVLRTTDGDRVEARGRDWVRLPGPGEEWSGRWTRSVPLPDRGPVDPKEAKSAGALRGP